MKNSFFILVCFLSIISFACNDNSTDSKVYNRWSLFYSFDSIIVYDTCSFVPIGENCIDEQLLDTLDYTGSDSIRVEFQLNNDQRYTGYNRQCTILFPEIYNTHNYAVGINCSDSLLDGQWHKIIVKDDIRTAGKNIVKIWYLWKKNSSIIVKELKLYRHY